MDITRQRAGIERKSFVKAIQNRVMIGCRSVIAEVSDGNSY